jgi:hypothetical protein
MTDSLFFGQVILQSKSKEDLEEATSIFEIFDKTFIDKGHHYELIVNELNDEEIKTYKGKHDIDEEVTLFQDANFKPSIDVFHITYRLKHMNQTNFQIKDYHFYEYNFNPFTYQTIHGQKKPKTIKEAVMLLVDDIRRQDGLREIPSSFKTSKLYHQMINAVLKDVYRYHYYDLMSFETSSELKNVLILLDAIEDHFDACSEWTYDFAKSIYILFKEA